MEHIKLIEYLRDVKILSYTMEGGRRVEEYSGNKDKDTGNQANVNTKPLLTRRITEICARKVIIHNLGIKRIYKVIKCYVSILPKL